MYVQCEKCLWEGYTAALEEKTSGKSEPMKCPECGENEIVDRETVPDDIDDLIIGLLDSDLEYDQDDGYGINEYY